MINPKLIKEKVFVLCCHTMTNKSVQSIDNFFEDFYSTQGAKNIYHSSLGLKYISLLMSALLCPKEFFYHAGIKT